MMKDEHEACEPDPNPPIRYRGYTIYPWVHTGGNWTCKIYRPDGEWVTSLPRSGRYGTFSRMRDMAEKFVDVDIEEESWGIGRQPEGDRVMNTEQSLSGKMLDELHVVDGFETEQQLADRLARLAYQYFGGRTSSDTGAEHYERVLLTCGALEGALSAAGLYEGAETVAYRAVAAVDHALQLMRDGMGTPEPQHVCAAYGCDDPPRYCGAHAPGYGSTPPQGVDRTVSAETDAATVTDEVYRLQSLITQVLDMAEALSPKQDGEAHDVLTRTSHHLTTAHIQIGRYFGVYGAGGDSNE